MKNYNRRVWLNSKKSASTGSLVCFSGFAQWGKETPAFARFIEIADCHNKIKLHQSKFDSKEEFIQKVDILIKELAKFKEYLKSEKDEEESTPTSIPKENKWKIRSINKTILDWILSENIHLDYLYYYFESPLAQRNIYNIKRMRIDYKNLDFFIAWAIYFQLTIKFIVFDDEEEFEIEVHKGTPSDDYNYASSILEIKEPSQKELTQDESNNSTIITTERNVYTIKENKQNTRFSVELSDIYKVDDDEGFWFDFNQ